MAYAEKGVVIDRPISDVYGFVADGSNNRKWRTGVVGTTLHTGKSGEKGAVYRQAIKGPGGRTVDGDYQITSAQVNQRLSFVVVSGPSKHDGHYFFEKTDGGTKVTFAMEVHLKGLAKMLNDAKMSKDLQAEVDKVYTLKRILEQEPPR